MNNQLIGRIHDRMSGFSKGQKRIAKYIEEHYDKVAFMTASKLGATVGVSESTVVRFATEIGYSGYPELQRAMQEMIRSRLTSVQRLEITAQNLEIPQLLSAVLNQDIDIIRRTNEETSHEDFYQAVDAIVDARRVYIMGARSSHALATFLSYYFNLIFDSVRLVNCSSEAEIFEQMVNVGKDDAVVAISFPVIPEKWSRPFSLPQTGAPEPLPSRTVPCLLWQKRPLIGCWLAVTWLLLWILWSRR